MYILNTYNKLQMENFKQEIAMPEKEKLDYQKYYINDEEQRIIIKVYDQHFGKVIIETEQVGKAVESQFFVNAIFTLSHFIGASDEYFTRDKHKKVKLCRYDGMSGVTKYTLRSEYHERITELHISCSDKLNQGYNGDLNDLLTIFNLTGSLPDEELNIKELKDHIYANLNNLEFLNQARESLRNIQQFKADNFLYKESEIFSIKAKDLELFEVFLSKFEGRSQVDLYSLMLMVEENCEGFEKDLFVEKLLLVKKGLERKISDLKFTKEELQSIGKELGFCQSGIQAVLDRLEEKEQYSFNDIEKATGSEYKKFMRKVLQHIIKIVSQ